MNGPFSVYVHVPWCRVICPYCDFNVHRASGMAEERYVDALVTEIEHAAAKNPFRGRAAETIYFGGGTPSLFAPGSIERVVVAIRESFPAPSGPSEVTLEANPENLEPERLAGYRAAGVDRLSIGIESFDPRHLRTLGRAATAEDALHAVARARASGFDNLSLDLMFGIPGESLADWQRDLAFTVAAEPEHVSAYGLTYETGTPFASLRAARRLEPVDEDVEAEMFETARATLAAAGYDAYEISNYARPGRESRHNRNYWRGGDYLGIGAGAHSHAGAGDRARRWWNVREPGAYGTRALESGSAVAEQEELDRTDTGTETVFLGLRTRAGIDRAAFRERFAVEPEEMFPTLAKLVEDGFVITDARGVRLTERGILLADEVIAAAV